jgi:hypothetical protein
MQKKWVHLIHGMNQTLEDAKWFNETASARAANLGVENSILAFVPPGRNERNDVMILVFPLPV